MLHYTRLKYEATFGIIIICLRMLLVATSRATAWGRHRAVAGTRLGAATAAVMGRLTNLRECTNPVMKVRRTSEPL
jgi:hypothetical protein